MIKAIRLGHATVSSPDIERQVDYYVSVLGLNLLDKTADRAVLATKIGYEALVIERGDAPRLLRLGFQISPDADLEDAGKFLHGQNINFDTRRDITPGVKAAIVLQDGNDTGVELYSNYEFPTADRKPSAIFPLKLGHVARWVVDVKKSAAFYQNLLGFRVSDWRTDVSIFMRCNQDHHSINVFKGDVPGLAHLAFELKDWAELQRACDVLAAQGMQLDWGPSRHNIGHNIACYHKNPDGLRIELYTEMDQMKDEALGYFEPRPWHEDVPQRPKVWPLSTSKNYWGLWGSQ